MSIRVLFFILVAAGGLLFEELDYKLQYLLPLHDCDNDEVPSDDSQLSLDIENWMRCYEMLRQYVEELNTNFGFIVLANLAWIFSESISAFFEGIFTYTFIVSISLQFNVWEMATNVLLLELNLNPHKYNFNVNGTPDALEVLTSIPSYDALRRSTYYELGTYYGMAMILLKFIAIWLRLLLILVPSYRLHAAVSR